MINLANAITLLRVALVPLLALQVLRREYDAALVLFIVSALSDLADGQVARHWHQATRFGAIADPLADKLTMLTVMLLLALQGLLAWWFALAAVLRDLIIVGGATAYHFLIGPVPMAPSRLSKLNTALEFLLLAAILASAAGYFAGGGGLRLLLLATFVTVLWSGAHYVLVWARKAGEARRAPP